MSASYPKCKEKGCNNLADGFYGYCNYHWEDQKVRKQKENKKSRSKKPTKPVKLGDFWWNK